MGKQKEQEEFFYFGNVDNDDLFKGIGSRCWSKLVPVITGRDDVIFIQWNYLTHHVLTYNELTDEAHLFPAQVDSIDFAVSVVQYYYLGAVSEQPYCSFPDVDIFDLFDSKINDLMSEEEEFVEDEMFQKIFDSTWREKESVVVNGIEIKLKWNFLTNNILYYDLKVKEWVKFCAQTNDEDFVEKLVYHYMVGVVSEVFLTDHTLQPVLSLTKPQ